MRTAIVCLFLCFMGYHLLATTNKYRCILRDNPATTMTIGWNQVNGSNPKVYYDIVDHGTNVSAYPFSRGVDRVTSRKGMNNHFSRLTGLSPNTVYYFIIVDNNSNSQRFSFKTSPNVPTERLSFIAGGDSRNNRTARQSANKMVAKVRANAVMFGGDMTNGDSSGEWSDWFEDWQLTTAADGRMTPIIAARGNHEDFNTSISELFDTPNSAVYYAITFGGNLYRAYTLNSMISVSGAQKTWLQNDLQTNQQITWKSVQYHHPMRPHVSSKTERNDMVTHWAPLFENYGVNYAVECDAHTVKATYPIRTSNAAGSDEGFIRDDANGVVYVGEGCWGAPLRSNNDSKSWTRATGSFNQIKWIFVDQNTIEIRTIKVDNSNQVAALTDANRFSMPTNINLWELTPGEKVMYIHKNNNTTTKTTTAQVSQGSDDAEERSGGSMNLTSTDLELVDDTGTGNLNQMIGVRFSQVSVPAGARIENAYIQFTCDERGSTTTNLTIQVEDVAHSNTFTSTSRNISNRSTYGQVSWSNLPAWNTVGASTSGERTSDLARLVQHIVDKNGWDSGNAMTFIISGSGKRTAESFNGSSSKAARLVIEYQEVPIMTVSTSVSQGSDDAEERSGGSMNLTSTDLELVDDTLSTKILKVQK